MNVDQLVADEPLSPELVLVLPAELRARVLAGLGPPVRPRAPLQTAAPAVAEPFAGSLGGVLLWRVAQLGLTFVAVTILTLAMSLVAHAVR